jgi:uncharacterized membrane protein YeaQ/YmgE (transglycosylase-associated protein family)
VQSSARRSCYSTVLKSRSGRTFPQWIILGLIAGFVASKIVKGTGSGIATDLILGIIGAIGGGVVMRLLVGLYGLNLISIIVAAIGAVVVLWIYHGVVARS